MFMNVIIAHFCSLFCSVFELLEFDIEDFKEALLIATDANNIENMMGY